MAIIDQTVANSMHLLVTQPTAVSLADDVVLVDHAQDKVYKGSASVSPILTSFFGSSFAGKVEIRTLLVQDGTALLEAVVCGRHQRPFMGIPPTARAITLPLALICRWQDGCLSELAFYYDAGSLLRQLDLAL